MPTGKRVSGGKKLEREMLQSLRTKRGWVVRMNDKFTMVWSPRGLIPVSVESPPDLLLVGTRRHLLLECKEVKGPSIGFLRLHSHQLQALREFQWQGKRFRAYVIVQYIGVKGQTYLCVAIPIRRWLKEERRYDRMSLNWKRAVEIGIRLERIKGSMWQVAPLFTA